MISAARVQPTARTEPSPADILAAEFGRVRDTTLALCSSLEIEDCVVQTLPEASPTKWHLAHTTWFFEQFVLGKFDEDYRSFDTRYDYLFNSYYHSIGPQFERGARGMASRPTVSDVIRYRRFVDEAVQNLLRRKRSDSALHSLLTLGLNHEQQHQELILTDIKHALSRNPSLPAYRPTVVHVTDATDQADTTPVAELHFVEFEGGLQRIGADGSGYCFDNECPQHRVLIAPFALANRLITNGEYLEFVRAGGYRNPQLWLADGWDVVNAERWWRPLYWDESLHSEFTLHGEAELNLEAPVCHLSYFEADAFARWSGKRLPTEVEWELAASAEQPAGNLLSRESLHPLPVAMGQRSKVKQLFGDTWEWTSSAYLPYPGYRAPEGALGEYNGKFMSGRMVLRGGSCVTPDDHIRATYRNYFDPKARWQFSGVRLAQ